MSQRNKFIYEGRVLNNRDPLMLGRLRVYPTTPDPESDIYPQDWDESMEWSSDDPLIFLPLIPYYLNQTPLEGEYVHVVYYNTGERLDRNKFYIQGPISRPWFNGLESFANSKSMLADGQILKQAKEIRNKTNGDIDVDLRGIYPLPGDNGFLGRGSSDIILKTSQSSNDVLIRAGKTRPSGNPVVPVRLNDSRSFVQVSEFGIQQTLGPVTEKEELIYTPRQVKYLIEWEVSNLNTTPSPSGITFDGSIRLYSLKPVENTLSSVLTVNTPLDEYIGNTLFELDFTGKTVIETSQLINSFIRGFNNGRINIPGYVSYPSEPGVTISDQFPFVFRPVKSNLDTLSTNNTTEYNNLIEIYNKIKLSPSDTQNGYALVWLKNVINPQPELKKTIIQNKTFVPDPVTYTTNGGDFVYLLSHKQSIPSKEKFSLKDTLYGIPREKFDEIIYKTDPMVRGDELMSFLTLLTKFVFSHVHNINEAPIPVGTDGTLKSDILKKLLEADSTILNQNIRIN
jgi:hypothetical protein